MDRSVVWSPQPGPQTALLKCPVFDVLFGGLSWTTSLEYAKFYAQQYGKSQIIKRIVNKKEVFAYINRNKESEILIL